MRYPPNLGYVECSFGKILRTRELIGASQQLIDKACDDFIVLNQQKINVENRFILLCIIIICIFILIMLLMVKIPQFRHTIFNAICSFFCWVFCSLFCWYFANKKTRHSHRREQTILEIPDSPYQSSINQSTTTTTMTKENPDCPYELSNEKEVFEGKWLIAKQVDFKLRGSATTGIWQTAYRPKRGNQLNADGVDIAAVLKKNGKKYLILIKQYRIPIRKLILEFPAGLIDSSDKSIEEAGIRELKEETGYTVTKILRCTSKGQFLNPGLSSDSSAFLLVEVDGSDPANQNPKQKLDTDEEIEVILVETDKLLEYLDDVTKNGDVEICSQVYSFALAKLF